MNTKKKIFLQELQTFYSIHLPQVDNLILVTTIIVILGKYIILV